MPTFYYPNKIMGRSFSFSKCFETFPKLLMNFSEGLELGRTWRTKRCMVPKHDKRELYAQLLRLSFQCMAQKLMNNFNGVSFFTFPSLSVLSLNHRIQYWKNIWCIKHLRSQDCVWINNGPFGLYEWYGVPYSNRSIMETSFRISQSLWASASSRPTHISYNEENTTRFLVHQIIDAAVIYLLFRAGFTFRRISGYLSPQLMYIDKIVFYKNKYLKP